MASHWVRPSAGPGADGFGFSLNPSYVLAGVVTAAQKTIDLVGIVSVWHGRGWEGLRARSACVSTR